MLLQCGSITFFCVHEEFLFTMYVSSVMACVRQVSACAKQQQLHNNTFIKVVAPKSQARTPVSAFTLNKSTSGEGNIAGMPQRFQGIHL